MPKILIVADDYTGANDTAVLAPTNGLSAYTVLARDLDKTSFQVDCVAVSTESRAVAPAEAYQAVREATDRFRTEETVLFSKRIDSTLRGNLGQEIDGMLDALGSERTAMVVPALPGAGRIYKDGCLYVNGVPLSRTAAARDPKNPVNTDSPLELLRTQSRYPACSISLNDVRAGVGHLLKQIQELQNQGYRLLLFEVETDPDLTVIAEAVTASERDFICVDPGVFTLACMRLLVPVPEEGKLLFVIGSVNQVTADQMEQLLKEEGTAAVYMDAAQAIESGILLHCENDMVKKDDPLLTALAQALETSQTVCLVTSGIFPEGRIDLDSYAEHLGVSAEIISKKLNEFMAALAARLVEQSPQIRGIFACGGDTAAALCQKLHAQGEYPLEEVIPLAVYGVLEGGIADGMPIITKGGMVGDRNTLIQCRRFLNEKRRERKS